jgi:uncharacterized protein
MSYSRHRFLRPRHGTSPKRVGRSANLLAVALLTVSPGFARGGQPSSPSFNCARASNPAEREICRDPTLAGEDERLAATWRSLASAFNDVRQLAQVKHDQMRWLRLRNACLSDRACLERQYRERIGQLTGGDPHHPLAGVFQAKDIGAFALYPIGSRYLVSIQTADPSQGSWTCEVAGIASLEGNRVEIETGRLHFAATFHAPDVLTVESGSTVEAVEGRDCGLNGTFALRYTRPRSSFVESADPYRARGSTHAGT